ncbi:MAG TPA: hypothetical protein VGJ74_22615 [Burkholderiales bacterium]
MSAKNLVLILALAAGAITVGYAMQRPAAEEPMPAAEGVEIPQIVIVAKRERVADHHR